MAYSVPTTRSDGYVVDATEWNKNTVDNPAALRAGEIAIASQAAGDIVTAASASQLGRMALSALGLHAVCDGRLTLTTALPITTADVTAATTLYFTPFRGAQIGLYDGSAAWSVITFAELSIAVPATTATIYDVFVYNNAGTATLELTAWTNDTTRATALTLQNGLYVKTGATTRRYVGSFRTTAVSGQTEDSAAKRYVWNYYNRAERPLMVHDSTNSWTYTTATWRQANGAAGNQLDIVNGVAEDAIDVVIMAASLNATASADRAVAVGEDSTSAPSTAGVWTYTSVQTDTDGMAAHLRKIPAVGRHFYAWLEYSLAVGSTTWVGDGGATYIRCGITATWRA